MNYSVNITAQAETAIRAIYEYFAISLMSPENAAAQLSRLEERIGKLDNMPRRYHIYKNDIRIMPVDNYLVFFSVDDDQKTVSILRIMYGRRNVENII